MLKFGVFLMMAVAACGADDADDLHAHVDCDPGVGQGITNTCARACQSTTFQGELPGCIGMWDGVEHACANSTQLPDGEIGCCHFNEENGKTVLEFMVCE